MVVRNPGIAGSRPRALRLAEMTVLYYGLPTIYLLGYIPLPKVPFLLVIVAGIGVALALDKTFDRRVLWNAAPLRAEWRRIALTFAAGGACMVAYTAVFHRERLFELMLHKPWMWAALMVIYPLLSVYPQEVAYRTFFYHRYAPALPGVAARILLNAAAFGYMHIVYENAIAVVLTAVGGVLFARTYERTDSTLASSFEHGLYGCLIFTIGLGEFFS